MKIKQLKFNGVPFYPKVSVSCLAGSDGLSSGVDSKPRSGSTNLITSGAMYDALQQISTDNDKAEEKILQNLQLVKDAIATLSPEQLSAISVALTVLSLEEQARHAADDIADLQEFTQNLNEQEEQLQEQVDTLLTQFRNQINGFTIVSLSEEEYQALVDSGEVDDMTLYFVEEAEDEEDAEQTT